MHLNAAPAIFARSLPRVPRNTMAANGTTRTRDGRIIDKSAPAGPAAKFANDANSKPGRRKPKTEIMSTENHERRIAALEKLALSIGCVVPQLLERIMALSEKTLKRTDTTLAVLDLLLKKHPELATAELVGKIHADKTGIEFDRDELKGELELIRVLAARVKTPSCDDPPATPPSAI
jgi:hypothetical protein